MKIPEDNAALLNEYVDEVKRIARHSDKDFSALNKLYTEILKRMKNHRKYTAIAKLVYGDDEAVDQNEPEKEMIYDINGLLDYFCADRGLCIIELADQIKDQFGIELNYFANGSGFLFCGKGVNGKFDYPFEVEKLDDFVNRFGENLYSSEPWRNATHGAKS